MEIFDGRTATLCMMDRNILLVTLKKNTKIDVADVEENYEFCKRLTAGSRYVSLVDARTDATITDAAKTYSAQPDMYTHTIAQAIVITSLATRLIANFLIQFHKKNNNVEMKLFNDYDKALAWLREQLLEDQVAVAFERFKPDKIR